MTNLESAMRYFAETYCGAVVGSDWDDACDYAEIIVERFRWRYPDNGPMPDGTIAQHLYSEAARYEDM